MSKIWRSFYFWWGANIRRQLVIPVVVVTMFGLVMIGSIVIKNAQSVLERQVMSQSARLATLGADQISTLFQDLINLSRLQQQQMLAIDDPAGQGRALLALQQNFSDAYISLQILDAQNRTMMTLNRGSSSGVGTIQNFTPPQSFTGTTQLDEAVRNQQLYVSPVDYQPITDTPFVTVAIPLITSTQEGTLIIEVDARFFWKRVDTIRIESGSVMIVDDQGAVLAHPDRQRIGQKIVPELLDLVIQRSSGSTVSPQHDTEYFVTYAPLSGILNWGVIIEQNRAAVLGPVRQITTTMVLITLLSAVLIGAVLSFLIGHTLLPVGQLSKQAAQIASSGDFSHDLRISRHDELGTLATTLNQMLNNLRESHTQVQQSNDHLEQQVSERTVELQSALEEIEERSRRQNELLALIQQLSMPIIPIMPEVVIVPLVGELTEARAHELNVTLLQTIQQQQVRVAIIDITGIPVIDPQIARTFVKVAYGAQMMGASVILAGIRPEIAQVLVTVGIPLEDLYTAATLDQGFIAAKRLLNTHRSLTAAPARAR